MKVLQDILYKTPIVEVSGNLGIQIADFHFDSRAVDAGSLFIALKGVSVDGHAYIGKAVEQGATAVVCEHLPADMPAHVTWIRVKDSALALACIAANFYDNPAQQLRIVGVTGTNGKTTVATLLYKLHQALGYTCGLLSTVAVRIGEQVMPATHTTPDAKALHRAFREMADAGCEFCFMEVSSHALEQQRVAGIPFAGALFTNLTHDHLDYHGTFANYLAAKKKLFDMLGAQAFALTNEDDRNGAVMLQNTVARRRSYSLKKLSDYKARILDNTFEGLQLDLDGREVWFRLVGSFNAYNLLAVYGAAVELGSNAEEVLVALSRLDGADGRFQTVTDEERSRTAIVDYAHTPDALKNVLDTIRDIRTGTGRIITVVGCGGNRDREKRPVMARIAAELSDLVVLTSDNPRNENPADILAEMATGVSPSLRRKVQTIENRRDAIEAACRLATPGDIILVAGKGHENYQEIQGVKHPFDDRLVLLETFNLLRS